MLPTQVVFKIKGVKHSPVYQDAFTLMEYLNTHFIKFDITLSRVWFSIRIDHDKGTLHLPFSPGDGMSLLEIQCA